MSLDEFDTIMIRKQRERNHARQKTQNSRAQASGTQKGEKKQARQHGAAEARASTRRDSGSQQEQERARVIPITRAGDKRKMRNDVVNNDRSSKYAGVTPSAAGDGTAENAREEVTTIMEGTKTEKKSGKQ